MRVQDWMRDGRQLVFAHAERKPSCAGAESGDQRATCASYTHVMRTQSRQGFLEALGRDTDFLRQMRLIDYSILVGVHECAKSESESSLKVEQTPGACSTPAYALGQVGRSCRGSGAFWRGVGCPLCRWRWHVTHHSTPPCSET